MKFRCIFGVFSLLLVTNYLSAQLETNLVSNPSFEQVSGGMPDDWQSNNSPTSATGHFIHGGRSLRFNLLSGPVEGSSVSHGVSQLISTSFAAGDEFVLTANVRAFGGNGTVYLLARFNDDPSTDQAKYQEVKTSNWERIKVKIKAPTGATSVRVFCGVIDTTNYCYIDFVQLIPLKDYLANEDFEDDGAAWTIDSANGASIHQESTEDKFFEFKSLKIEGEFGQPRYATRYVAITSDEPIYQLTYYVKMQVAQTEMTLALGEGAQSPTPSSPNVNLEDPDRDLAPIHSSGANISILATGGSEIRLLNPPRYDGTIGEFIEQKVSFLVPKGTTGLILTAQVVNSDNEAYFDNVRLTTKSVADGVVFSPNGMYSDVGHLHSVVEAPSQDTYIAPTNTQTAIQDAIDDSTGPGTDFGKQVWLQAGTYSVAVIELKTGTRLRMHQAAIIQRNANPPGTSGFTSALIRNLQDDIRISDVTVEGGEYDRNNIYGGPIAVSGDRVIIRNMHIPSWSIPSTGTNSYPAQGIWLFGHDNFVYHNTMAKPGGGYDPVYGYSDDGYDGIHLWAANAATSWRMMSTPAMTALACTVVLANFLSASISVKPFLISTFVTSKSTIIACTRTGRGRLPAGTPNRGIIIRMDLHSRIPTNDE